MNTLRWLKYISWGFCFLVGIMFSLKATREPDLWWILATGEWILDNGRVVNQDVFSYTFNGTSWINVKWLFEVLAYLMTRIGGPELVFLYQMIANLVVVYMISRIFKHFRVAQGKSGQDIISVGLVLATYLALIGWEFRINGRPEMTTYAMSLVYVHIFLRHRNQGGKGIFWLIPLQILWTNLHEAYGTGMVLLVVFALASLWEYGYSRRNETVRPFPKQLLLASVLALVAVSINPRGPQMLAHPFEIFSQLGDNKFTTELTGWDTDLYWQQKEPYMALIMVILALISIVVVGGPGKSKEKAQAQKGKSSRKRKTSKPSGLIPLFTFIIAPLKGQAQNPKLPKEHWIYRSIDGFGLGYILVLLLFYYLSLGAVRNTVFPILISAPAVALLIDRLFSRFQKKEAPQAMWPFAALIGLGALLYVSIGSNTYYEQFNPNDRYGLEVDALKNPAGAAEYIRTNNVQGNCFSDYLTSAYLLWDLRPDFKTFIDLRDLDVFPVEFFQEFAAMLVVPENFKAGEEKYGFDYAVVHRARFPSIHQILWNDPTWHLAFADPIAAIYIKDNETNRELVDSIKTLGKKDIFSDLYYPKASGFATALSKIFWPPYQANQKLNIDPDVYAANYYYSLGEYELALPRAQKASTNGIDDYLGFNTLGNIYFDMSRIDEDPQKRQEYLELAGAQFARCLSIDKDRPECYKGLGYIEAYNGNWKKANEYLVKVHKAGIADLTTYKVLVNAQNTLIGLDPGNRETYQKNYFVYMENALALNPGDPTLRGRLGIVYCLTQDDCEKASEYLQGITTFPEITPQEAQQLKSCRQKCGVN